MWASQCCPANWNWGFSPHYLIGFLIITQTGRFFCKERRGYTDWDGEVSQLTRKKILRLWVHLLCWSSSKFKQLMINTGKKTLGFRTLWQGELIPNVPARLPLSQDRISKDSSEADRAGKTNSCTIKLSAADVLGSVLYQWIIRFDPDVPPGF